MIDELLGRHSGRGKNGSANDNTRPDDGEIDDLGTFGFLRGSRERAVMLELRKKDGNILAVGYGWLERISFDPSEGITLHVPGQTVRIKGRNLNAEAMPKVKLFEAIARHRVPWIQELGEELSLRAPKGVPVIDSIEW